MPGDQRVNASVLPVFEVFFPSPDGLLTSCEFSV